MSLQQRKEQIMKMYKDRRDLEKFRNNQQKYQNNENNSLAGNMSSGLNIGRTLYGGIKSFQQPNQPSTDFAGKVGAGNFTNNLGSGLSNPTATPQMGNYGLNTQTFQNNGELANKIGATNIGGASSAAETTSKLSGAMDKFGKAMPVVGAAMGGLNAANNFANGNTVDGALDLAKTGAMFIPGVGWAASAAIEIAQMLKGAKDKADQKAMAKSQEEAIKSQELAESEIDNTKQGLEQQRQENLNNMQQQMQPAQSNQDIVNDLMTQYNNYDSEQGVPTGGAAPVQMPTNYSEENAPALPYEGSATQGLAEGMNDNTSKVQSILSGLKALGGKIGEGITDFSAGYQDNAVNGFKDGDLFNQIKSNNNEVIPSQTAEGVMTGGANEMKKTIMNRLGELAGTGSRVMANPWTQAGIAALATKATGGDGADILNNAYKYGIDKAKSNYYAKLMNPDKPLNALQNLTADDYKAKLTKDNHDDTMTRWKYEQDWKQQKDKRDYDYKVNKDKEDRIYKDKELAIKQKYYKNRENNDSAARLAWQMEKDRRDNELKLAKQEFDYKNKQLANQTDFGSRDEEYQGLFGQTKTRKVPITQEEAQNQAYEEYMNKVNSIMNGSNNVDNEQAAIEAELRRRGLI